MQIPIQALEIARFASADRDGAIQWVQLKPLGQHIMQASATNGAMLAQFAWICTGSDMEEKYIHGKEMKAILKASGKRNRALGGTLNGKTLQVGNDAPKLLRIETPENIHFPAVESIIPSETLDTEGLAGSIIAMDLSLYADIYKWLQASGSPKASVRITTRGESDPIRVDIPVFDTGGRAVFVVMPSRL